MDLYRREEKNEKNSVSGVVLWFPPVDLLSMDKQLMCLGIKGQLRGAPTEEENVPQGELHGGANSPASLYMGDKLSNVPELVAENNPTNYITENTPPFFIEHGSIDNVVPYIQSVSFAEKLKEKSKNKVEIRIILGAKHGGPNFTTKENLDDVYQFINSVTK